MSSPSLKDRVTEDMKAAMRAKDSERLGTIRMITSAIKQREVDERIQLDDSQVLAVIEKMIKTRKESIAQFQSAGRDDLVAKEQKEVDLLQGYLPQQLSEAEVDALIAEAIAESGATSIKDMGKAMALLKQKAQGRTDMASASARLKARLGG
ncbi:MAG TPA: GatB/YqeY domain-containing protein [Steroidobacter sp.]|uniref:GatB/YqeY domain-containing protein n=1 Tax=Steroidobacter sp. TaxID=1978227 RepID=UPI002EDB0845